MEESPRFGDTYGPIASALAGLYLSAETRIRSAIGDELVVGLSVGNLREVVSILINQLAITHLTTITGEDRPPYITLKYHFWHRRGFTLEVELPGDEPLIPSIVDLIPGATLYEREVHGMFGVAFKGHADLEPLLLPDNWQGPPPLRKEAHHD